MVSTKVISLLLVAILVAIAGCQPAAQQPAEVVDDTAEGELGNDIDIEDTDDGVVPEVIEEEEEEVEDDRLDVSGDVDSEGVKEFFVEGENYFFTIDGKVNPDMVVNEGDTVRVHFTSTSGRHDWKLFGYNYPATPTVSSGGSGTVEFVAEEAGTFQYFCSVGNHRTLGMEGNFIVN